jgi:excisionase family DNA binding protein
MNHLILQEITLDDLKVVISEVISELLTKFLPKSDSKSDEDLIDIKEVAKILGISVVTAHSYKASGKIPFYRSPHGRRIYFRKSEVLQSLKKVERRQK